MPAMIPPGLRARSARCKAVIRWFHASTTADVMVRLHDAPRWPLIDGGKADTPRRRHTPGPHISAPHSAA